MKSSRFLLIPLSRVLLICSAAFLLAVFLLARVEAQTKFGMHGFLTQAYAISSDHPIFGINKEGTSDYRILALQFRYDIDPRNNLVVQFNHRRIGKSPVMILESDVSLDWAFFEHRFNDNLAIQIGKILLPFGLLNQIRDVGILLPFYRAPFCAYGEENYMSETVDGIVLSSNFTLLSLGEFELSAYGGRWSWVEWYVTDNPLTGNDILLIEDAQVDRGGGVQAFYHPRVDGMTIGLGLHGGYVTGGLSFSENSTSGFGPQSFWAPSFSLALERNQFFLRSEVIRFKLTKTRLTALAYYAQAGISLTSRISAVFQADFFRLYDLPVPSVYRDSAGKPFIDVDYFDDYAFGLRYSLNSSVILKAEHHWNKGFLFDDGSGGFYSDEPAKTNIFILSLSTSF